MALVYSGWRYRHDRSGRGGTCSGASSGGRLSFVEELNQSIGERSQAYASALELGGRRGSTWGGGGAILLPEAC